MSLIPGERSPLWPERLCILLVLEGSFLSLVSLLSFKSVGSVYSSEHASLWLAPWRTPSVFPLPRGVRFPWETLGRRGKAVASGAVVPGFSLFDFGEVASLP